ncbi:ATP-dependent DNA ligase [Ilumatobacter coccineus]|uniref:DNA ligase (ATP) n=1 Tax=Ilumatobacter coccineus (strain NBRC 103263 / KCTC 29153 / YM16-304) TaxID=1313172 RepID=A0A6C7EAG5_ILUCY|nr:ATP-dependent DNA ligase [Ilumatobacter coccineus]BAN03002.1 putative ATP-dependent DNA ligase [Ilumatobacter coccineus YM16-304]
MLFDELAAASQAVAATTKRNDKVMALADALRRCAPDEIVPAVAFLTGTTPLGRIGVGWSTLADVSATPAADASWTVGDVDRRLRAIESLHGDGVGAARRDALAELLDAATEREQRLLRGILSGELRQGALAGVMTTAVAKAADVPVAAVRRASMMAGDLGAAAHAALVGGIEALDAVSLQPLRPVQPMLASAGSSVADAFSGADAVQVDWKLDGIRLQAHRRGNDVGLFTRNLNEVTDRLPGVVEVVRSLPGGDLVLDGEAMGLLDDGSPRRFQDTMGDFGADRPDDARPGEGRGDAIGAFFFDILHVDGSPVHDEALSTRRELLAATVPDTARLPSIITAEVAEAEAFLGRAIAAGHEGVMVKDLDQPYEAGRRGKGWRKVKPVHTLDLVVLAVEWGHGRRRGMLSNIHLGARASGESANEFVMVGKTFKGMTDEMLRWQTARFSDLKIGEGTGRERHVVYVEPVQVVEIAVDGVQVSTTYPGGVALRFARVKQYRHDKSADTADTIDAVRALL